MKPLFVYAQLVRLPNTFTVLADILLCALATGQLVARWNVLLCLLAASTLLYWSGMIWNDYFDINQDRKERPGRPLASGAISMRVALLLGVGCMLGGVLFAVLADWFANGGYWMSTPIAVLLVIAIFLYDGAFKQSWAAPILMGSCRFLNILLGLSILSTWAPGWGWLVAIVIGVYIAGVTWFASSEAGDSKQSTLIGASIVLLVSLVLTLTVPALALESSGYFVTSPFFPYLLALFGSYLGVAILSAIQRPQPLRVQAAIKRAILGLIVLDALIASAFVGSLGLLLVLLLIPGMVLGRWLYST